MMLSSVLCRAASLPSALASRRLLNKFGSTNSALLNRSHCWSRHGTRLFSSPTSNAESTTMRSLKFPPRDPKIEPRIYTLITKTLTKTPVVLFMKGTPEYPKCGFSRLTSQILDFHGVEYAAVDVLEDEDLRDGIKVFGQWPTIPQVYFNGELVGGCDIVRGLHESGDLKRTFGVEEMKE